MSSQKHARGRKAAVPQIGIQKPALQGSTAEFPKSCWRQVTHIRAAEEADGEERSASHASPSWFSTVGSFPHSPRNFRRFHAGSSASRLHAQAVHGAAEGAPPFSDPVFSTTAPDSAKRGGVAARGAPLRTPPRVVVIRFPASHLLAAAEPVHAQLITPPLA